jgi:hypothetical protein
MGKKEVKKSGVPFTEHEPYTSLDQVVLGATYFDVVSESSGICTVKKQCMTGCDRVTLTTRGEDPKYLDCDISHLQFVDDGVSERFKKLADNPVAVKGAPSAMSSVLR